MARIIRVIKASAPSKFVKKKVAAYARVSSDKDSMHQSLSAQISYFSDLIQRNPEWEFVRIYADEAKTGTKDTREEFQNMLSDCREGKIDLIITKSVSRFARNTLTMLEVVRELKALNIDVYFEKENIHSISGDGELMLTILASFAQAESLSVSENCKWRVRKSYAEGESINLRFIYGYDISGRSISINEFEAQIVRRIFNDYISGIGATRIANDLRTQDVKRPRGGVWTSAKVMKIIKNEKYVGDSLLQKRYVSNHLEKKLINNNGALPQYYVRNSHPAIVSREIFDEANKILKERTAGVASKKVTWSPLRGLVKCTECGKYYRRKHNHGRVYLVCGSVIDYGKDACKSKYVRESRFTELLKRTLGIDCLEKDLIRKQIQTVLINSDGSITINLVSGKSIYFEEGCE
ncbi:recombinase family protein [Youngiibacter multivorans]|uniref:DNA invertase Pin-like site-specific DNA recombinase n=1 Tax=Youngiibacter multivorans TaxID=937251 RepID=A0ABS4G7X3_9CLOT|nr:recombinase family protein [Youngiibacter multivorans]MBP1920646.1 DNA invertase Pin-like site-specific DNA recombinase [Youngiibacter multivorans]